MWQKENVISRTWGPLQGLSRPAAAEDLLDGAELEQRLKDEGRLDEILSDPELMADWEAQLHMKQAS